MKRIGQEILNEWVGLVAEKLGKTREEILSRGLTATDFAPSRKVVLSNPSDMECIFSGAFSVIDSGTGRVAVFTEHCGYHEFYLSGVKVSGITSYEYWDEDYRE